MIKLILSFKIFILLKKKRLELIDDKNFDLKDFLDDNNNEKITCSPESK